MSATLRAIAKASGLCASTVSRALRNDPRISPETARVVREAAERLGYKPHPLVGAFAAHMRGHRGGTQTANLAVLVPTQACMLLRSGFKPCIDALKAAAEERGMVMDVIYYAELEGRKLDAVLEARGIQGVVIGALRSSDPPLEFKFESYAGVLMGNRQHKPPYSLVCNDQFHSALLATRTVAERGYRRIGLQLYSRVHAWTEHRFAGGYMAGVLECALPTIPPLMADRLSPAALRAWMEEHRIDAIVSAHPECCETLRELRFSIPDEIGFANLHQNIGPRNHSGIDQNDFEVTRASVEMLVDQLNRNERGLPPKPRIQLLQGKWVEGETVRARR